MTPIELEGSEEARQKAKQLIDELTDDGQFSSQIHL